jgi:hypothetical protein
MVLSAAVHHSESAGPPVPLIARPRLLAASDAPTPLQCGSPGPGAFIVTYLRRGHSGPLSLGVYSTSPPRSVFRSNKWEATKRTVAERGCNMHFRKGKSVQSRPLQAKHGS